MARAVTNPVAGPFFPNGATTEFPFDFGISSTSEVRVLNVTAAGVLTGEVSSSLYTVTLAGDGEGGTVTFGSAPDAATYPRLYVVGDPDFDQEAAFSSTGAFTPSSLNNPLDHESGKGLLLRHRSDRSLRFQDFDSAMDPITLALFKGKRLGFNATTGQPEGAVGTSDITQPEIEVLAGVYTVSSYGTIGAALIAAIAAGSKVTVYEDTTVQIPTDAATLQIACDRIRPADNDVTITLNIETGHEPASGVTVADGNWSQFKITSTDAEVTLASGFGTGVNFIAGDNALMPVLDCLIDADSMANRGYSASNGSRGRITATNGIKNVYGTSLFAIGGSTVYAENTVWTGAAKNAATGAAITSWGSVVYATGANLDNSDFYGGQAAHGGILNADGATADNAARYGFRATDAGVLSLDGAEATGCGVNAVRAANGALVNAQDFVGTGCSDIGMEVIGSYVHADGANFSGATNNGISVFKGGHVNFEVGNAQKGGSPAATDIRVDDGGIINATGATGGTNITKNLLTGNGIIMDDNAPDVPFISTPTVETTDAATVNVALDDHQTIWRMSETSSPQTLYFPDLAYTEGFMVGVTLVGTQPVTISKHANVTINYSDGLQGTLSTQGNEAWFRYSDDGEFDARGGLDWEV